MMRVPPTHAMQQEICCLMAEVEQLRRDKSVFAGMVKQLRKDLSAKVRLSRVYTSRSPVFTV